MVQTELVALQVGLEIILECDDHIGHDLRLQGRRGPAGGVTSAYLLARPRMFGVPTLLVLFVVPALFSVFADLGLTSEAKIRSEMEVPRLGAGPPEPAPPRAPDPGAADA